MSGEGVQLRDLIRGEIRKQMRAVDQVVLGKVVSLDPLEVLLDGMTASVPVLWGMAVSPVVGQRVLCLGFLGGQQWVVTNELGASVSDYLLESEHTKAIHDALGIDRLGEIIYFTSSGSFVKADYLGLRAVRVRMVAGGGAGGGAPATGASQISMGSGGGGGAYAESLLLDSALGASETVTRGAGGSGSAGANGGAGGDSSFGSHVSAKGGGGGVAIGPQSPPGTAVAGQGGSRLSSAGQLRIGGGAGDMTMAIDQVLLLVGGGGSSLLGPKSRQTGATGPGSNGFAGELYGGAGAGSWNLANQGTARAGGGGAGGIVIVEVYY